jgi:hypothetical protein
MFSVLVTDADGRPWSKGWIEIRLDAPQPGRFFSTDFPLVEGTRLIEIRLPLTGRRVEWKYTLPIRGAYRLSLDAIDEEGKKASKTFQIDVRENRNKWILLTVFVLALFGAGVIAGRIFSPASRDDKDARSMIILCLVAGLFIPRGAGAGAINAETGYAVQLEIEPASVGKPSKIRWRLEGEDPATKALALLTFSIVHKEKEKTVFKVERVPVFGQFEMAVQFTDAADYRVTSSAVVSGIGVVRAEKNLSASGSEPAITAQLPAMLFFLAVIVSGLAFGRWSQRARYK